MARIPKEPETERRVYVLPKELLDRMRAYQAENHIPSEVEVVRKLLDEALQAKDTIEILVEKVSAALTPVFDTRKVAKDILSGHFLVTYLFIEEDAITFALKDKSAAQVSIDTLGYGRIDDEGRFHLETDFPRDLPHASPPFIDGD